MRRRAPTSAPLLGRRAATAGLLALAASAASGSARAARPEGAPSPKDPAFPRWVLAYLDDLHRGDHSHGVMTMQVKTKHWTRSIEMEAWSKGKDYSLVRILAPKKERGTATLKVRENLYTYLSKTGRTIKITGGMMAGSWMGSHFTNDDLVKSTRMSEDYDFELTGAGKKKGTAVFQFTLTPKADVAVVWGKIVVTVRQEDLQPVEEIYFDEEGKQVRAMTFDDYREVGGRLLPLRMLMRPLDGSGEFTLITYEKLSFDVKLEQSLFTVESLRAL